MTNFDHIYDRTGTAEKYDWRQKIFGQEDLTPLWVADTDFAVPECVSQALKGRAEHPLFGYQVPRPEETLLAIVWWLNQQHGLNISPDDVLLSPSVVTSMGVAIEALTEPGDGVGVFTPIYPPFFKMVEYNERKCITLPLKRKNNRYEIDFERLNSALKNMKLLMLCNPHNPSGRVWSKDQLQQILTLCQTNNVLIFSDEIHSDIIMPGYQHTNFLSIAGAEQQVVLAHSIAKTFNCAGLRASFMVALDKGIREKIYRAQLKMHVDEVNIMGKIALAKALSPQGLEYQRKLIDYIAKNHELLEAHFLAHLPKCVVMKPESTFLAWVDFSGLGLEAKALSKILVEKAKVGLSEGAFFGAPGKHFQRINVGLPSATLQAALQRMSQALSADL